VPRYLLKREYIMRTITIIILFCGLLPAFLAAPSQAHIVVEAQSIDGSGNDNGQDIVVDSAGNRYLTGSFRERATFGAASGAVTLTSRGQDDAFIVKLDATGALVWVRQIGGIMMDQGRGLALAGDGSLYVTGLFNATANFVGSNVRLSSRGQSDIFIARYSRDGELIWALRAGGTATDNGVRIAVDGSGNAVATGNISNQATFADSDSPAAATLTSAGKIDIFIAKYDSQGRLIWARQAGGSGNDSGRAVAVAGSGDIYLGGGFSAVARFSSPGGSIDLSSAGSDDLFVARYNPDGMLDWAQRGGGANSDRALAITLDAQQNSYITGFFTNAAIFGSFNLTGQGKEIYLAKLGPDGSFLQAVSAGGAGRDEAYGVARDGQGTIYITGTYEDTAFFSTGGRRRELRQRSRAEVNANSSVFVAAFDASLQPTFVEGAGGEASPGQQVGNAVFLDNSGRANVTGRVEGGVAGMGNRIVAFERHGGGDIMLGTYASGVDDEIFFVSSSSGGTVDGINFADEDILAYDPANNRWSVLIDGSDIGLATTDIDAFEWIDPTTLLMSFDTPIVLPGIAGTVDDSDIVRFIPNQLGATTSGSFELFFDGSDVGLSSNGEDIDAIGIAADGRLMVSTRGPASVPAASGVISAGDEDVLIFNGSTGETTTGTWELFYDGTNDGLGDDPAEGVSALWALPTGEDFVFGPGAPVKMRAVQTGDGADLFRCELFLISGIQLCAPQIFFDSSAAGFVGEVVDAFSVESKLR
jgi:hypothetical protein